MESFNGKDWIIATIHNILYVPGLATNLFSIGAAAERGIKTTFERGVCIMSKAGKQVASGVKLNEKLYLMRFKTLATTVSSEQAMTTTEETMDGYHRKLGHIGVDKIKTVLKGLDMEVPRSGQINCEFCPGGKGRHVFHPSVGARATSPGRIHVDLSGISDKQIKSLERYKYYMLCKDESTSFLMIYFCKDKTEMPSKLAKLIIDFECIANTPVREIVSDNGGEFKNKTNELLFIKEHVVHETSAPYTPQQNGRIEREMQSINDIARTMSLASGLTVELWPQAVATSVYLKNRLPTKGQTTNFEQKYT